MWVAFSTDSVWCESEQASSQKQCRFRKQREEAEENEFADFLLHLSFATASEAANGTTAALPATFQMFAERGKRVARSSKLAILVTVIVVKYEPSSNSNSTISRRSTLWRF